MLKKKVKRSTGHFLFSKFSIWIVVKVKLCCFWHLCPWCVWLVREWTPTSEPTYKEQLKPTVTAHSLQQFGVLHTTEEQTIYDWSRAANDAFKVSEFPQTNVVSTTLPIVFKQQCVCYCSVAAYSCNTQLSEAIMVMELLLLRVKTPSDPNTLTWNTYFRFGLTYSLWGRHKRQLRESHSAERASKFWVFVNVIQ